MDETNITTKSRVIERRQRFGHRHKGTFWATAIAAVALTALMVCLPVSSAAPVGADASATSMTFKAPYPGTGSQILLVGSYGDCGYSYKTPVSPVFNVTTGVFKGSGNVTARSCGPSNVSSYLEPYGGVYPSYMTFTRIGGKHTVTLHWTVRFSYTITAKNDSQSSASADVFVEDYSDVLDDTNGSFFSSTGAFWYDSTTSGTLSGSVTVHFTAFINGTFAKKHVYEVDPELWVFLSASASVGGASASAALNMGTNGNSAKLTSVVVP